MADDGALLLTTNPGLEPLVRAELQAAHPSARVTLRPHRHLGRVRAEADAPDALERACLGLRSVHHVLRLRGGFALPPGGDLDDVRAAVAATALPELEGARAFRVRSRRHGDHPFQSPDVERAAGAVLVQRTGLPVDLKGEDAITVRVDLRERAGTIGVQRTTAALSHRFYPRPYQQRTSLKANVAFAALRALERPPRRLLDPFCGSGTILLEAGALFPEAALFGSDKKPAAADGAARNLAAFGFGERAATRQGEVERLGAHWSGERFDAIVTNPPYGVRMGGRLDFRRFYARLLGQLEPLLAPEGAVVLLATREEALGDAAARRGWAMEVVWRVETRSTTPAIARLTPG